jgi:cytochrome c peroxidase
MRGPRRPAIALLALATAFAASLARVASSADPEPQRGVPAAFKEGALVVPKGLPRPVVPASNPLTAEKIALGRRLFFDAALSRDRTKSCAHCHMPGSCFTDGRTTGLGVRDQSGPRNVPTIVNAAIAPALFWDGRASSLEAQAEGPILAPAELDMPEEMLVSRVEADPGYAPLFEAAFGSKTVALRRIAYALASYERTLLAADSAFDRYWFAADAKALAGAAERGYVVFRTKGACASCHVVSAAEAPFSDFGYHATGAGADGNDDPGRFAVTKREADRGRFRTPSLRNVALTAPYFHDGSAATLDDVVDHYDTLLGLGLSAGDHDDLVQYLLSL